MLLTTPEIYNLQNGSAGIRSTLCFRHHPNTSDYETTPGKGNTFPRSLVAIPHVYLTTYKFTIHTVSQLRANTLQPV